MDRTIQDMNPIIENYICFVYNELQTHGWQQRRIHFCSQCKILDYNGSSSDKEEFTFQEIMEKNNYDLDKTLLNFFCREIKWRGWIDAYYYYLHPEIEDKDFEKYWFITIILKHWIEQNIKKRIIIDELKSILGLDIELK